MEGTGQYICHLAARFDAVAEARPEDCAIRPPAGATTGEAETSFRDLQAASMRIAGHLSDLGIGRGDVVALLHDKSADAFAAMLACLRLGAIYTNLDPESPPERASRILETCVPALAIDTFGENSSPGPLVELVSGRGTRVLRLRSAETLAALERCEPTRGDDGVTGDSPAYIMFTSGSTGYPKGAVISHGSLLRFIDWGRDTFGVTPEDVFTNANPIYFDNSVFDFYVSLFNGASLVPFDTALAKDALRLVAAVGAAECTIWFSVPSLLVYLLTTRALVADSFPAIRKIIFGGEGFPKPKLRALYDLLGDRADLENVYGPTEATCICSRHTIREEDFEDMTGLATLGYLAPNFGYEILPSGEDAEGGDPDAGELFLTGPQIGLGYYRDPERSAEAFIQNPAQDRFREIGYRTGDLVRRDAEGRLHFRGRADFQIKHMGYRIELEEIEAAMNRVDGVREAAALYQQLGEGLGMIVGFVALEEEAETGEVEKALPRFLPSYMMPRRLVSLPQLPKNANGKIDRVAIREQHLS